jgi:hypothetical protein
MFRPGGMIESSKGEVDMSRHDKGTFCRMMEFIYTGMFLKLDLKTLIVFHSFFLEFLQSQLLLTLNRLFLIMLPFISMNKIAAINS